jgi:hypothetical protein
VSREEGTDVQALMMPERMKALWTAPLAVAAASAHVPPRVFQDIKEGLADRWVLEPHREHLITCSRCSEARRMAEEDRFDVFQYMEDLRLPTRSSDLVSRGRQLQRAFREFKRLNIVSGEASRRVWTDDVRASARAFLKRGGRATVVVGPLLSTDDAHKHPITELVGETGWEVYVSLHRQPVHFRVSDGARIFYVEMKHEAAADDRPFFFDRKNPWLSAYFAMRFEHILRSPNVVRFEDDPARLRPVRDDAVLSVREAVKELRMGSNYDDLTGEELLAVAAEAEVTT